MNGRFTIGFFLVFFFAACNAGAQVSCTYRLELYDSGGDGWNNAAVVLVIDGEPTAYTLNGFTDDGAFRAFDIDVMDGDTVTLIYSPGSNEAENSYAVYGPEGALLFGDGPSPTAGTRFTALAVCPSCPAPAARTITVDQVRARRADISWAPSSAAQQYVIEYGPAGFARGTGQRQTSSLPVIRLEDLAEKTAYDVYLFALCGEGDTSVVRGPISFQTLWTTDVGISAIVNPLTGCGLSISDTVRVGMTNFGGEPQTLVPFRYSVNNIDAGVPIPFDGFYTGVVGFDSTAIIDFETPFDFTPPGEYVITAWTELESDQDTQNDTTSVTITNIPIITTYPYFEDFERWGGGWTVDTNSRRPTWAAGRPDGAVIDRAASGERAWVTNLTGPYNAGERSILLSPCLDFSSFTQDPRLAFSLFFSSEACCDKAWVEASTDGGRTWARVGQTGTGLNWYNNNNDNANPADDAWSGDASGRGWVYAYNTLTGTAGASDVRLRLVFAADNVNEREGFAIDNVFIGTPLTNDLAAVNAVNTSAGECGAPNDRLRLTISNFGTATQRNFEVGYRINNGPPVIENVGALTLAPNQEAGYTFQATFNSEAAAELDIVAWTSLPNEGFRGNDTTRFVFRRARTLPFAENFEAAIVPPGWSVGDAIISNQRGNTSYVLADNLFIGDRDFTAATPVFGPVAAGDTLKFDYRFTLQAGDGSLPKELSAGEGLEVRISTDCGASYTAVRVIDGAAHTPTAAMTTVAIPLDAYAGRDVKIQFVASWRVGDYWIDIDNVNIRRCPPSLLLSARTTPASRFGARDGSASVTPGAGAAPFTYRWSTGDNTMTVDRLTGGAYLVTVTDRYGCSDVATVTVDFSTSVGEQPALLQSLTLAPNPTSGRSRLQVAFRQPAEVSFQVINLMGQVLRQTAPRRTDRLDEELDLSAYTGGLYLLRLVADGQLFTEKIILTK